MSPARKSVGQQAVAFDRKLRLGGFEIPECATRLAERAESAFAYVQILLNEGYLSATSVNEYGENVLCIVCGAYPYDDTYDCVKFLCEKGSDANFASRYGIYALSFLILLANYGKEPLIIKLLPILVEYGLDVNQPCPSGKNVLLIAFYMYRNNLSRIAQIIRLLVDNGYNNINQRFPVTFGLKPQAGEECLKLPGNPYVELLYGVIHKLDGEGIEIIYDLTCYLLEKDLDINCTNVFDCNALMLLANEPSCHPATLATARALLYKGINVNQRNIYGLNVLNLICFQEYYPAERLLIFTQLLLEFGIDVNTTHRDGRTNLQALLERRDRVSPNVWSVIVLLLERSTDIPCNVKGALWSMYLNGELMPEQLLQPAYRRFLLQQTQENCNSVIHTIQIMNYGVHWSKTVPLHQQISRALKKQERKRRRKNIEERKLRSVQTTGGTRRTAV